MIITGSHKTKIVLKSLQVLMASIDASLRYCIDPDLTSGYQLLSNNTKEIINSISRFEAMVKLPSLTHKKVVNIALERMQREYEELNRPAEEIIQLRIDIQQEIQSQEEDFRRARKQKCKTRPGTGGDLHCHNLVSITPRASL